MDEPRRDNPEDADEYHGPSEQRMSWLDDEREKIVAEIHANRRGEYTVPTWVLGVALVAMIVAICGFLVLA